MVEEKAKEKETRIKVYYTMIGGELGFAAHESLESVIEDLKAMDYELSLGAVYIIQFAEMDKEEFDNLPEFDGY